MSQGAGLSESELSRKRFRCPVTLEVQVVWLCIRSNPILSSLQNGSKPSSATACKATQLC